MVTAAFLLSLFLESAAIFAYDKIEDTATYENPHQYPKGIPYVLVNGKIVIDRGEHTGATLGRVIYGPGKLTSCEVG